MTAMNHGGITLSELLNGFTTVDADRDSQITGLELDSRNVHQGDCFIAISGTSSHGIDFIPDAVSNGAVAILVDSEDAHLISEDNQWNIIIVDQLAEKTGEIAHRYYGESTDLMKMFGVTGTNGKTSVSYFISQAIDNISGSGTCGVIGTLGNGLFGEFVSSGMTTPDAISLHQSVSRLRDQGAQATVIEASSHGLAQHRLSGVNFDVAVFTNLTRDHLDYHGDMQAYGEAKLELFKSPDLQAAVINLDDPFSEKIIDELSGRSDEVRIIGYSLNPESSHPEITTIHCSKLDVSVTGLIMEVDTPEGSNVLKTSLLGRFNASNLLAALGALMACGFRFQEALDALSEVAGVPGRMEAFVQDSLPPVVVDFAHTPDGLAKALETLREICAGNLWCVFGCGGDRDKGKRPLMGETVEGLADSIIITNDNPRSEDPEVIASGILSGMKKPDLAEIILDRKMAIETAINTAQPEDIILVAGKGHEDWQEIKGQRFPFNDRNVVLNILGKLSEQGGQDD